MLLPAGGSLDNIYLAPGPKAMEYRIATRRISSRGFSGTLLLQAELGSGSRAPEQVIAAIYKLKKNIKSALMQGDRFVIALSENDATSFHLNGVELLSIDDGSIFDFFFAGWVGESSSALLRDALLSGNLDAGTLTRFESLAPSDERLAMVSGWMAPPPPPPVPTPAPKKPAPVQVAEAPTAKAAPITAPLSAAERVAAPVAVVDAATTAVASTPTPVPTPTPAPVATTPPAEEAMQVALVETAATGEVEIDDREYQRQLSEYVTHIMKKIFGKVVYPKRAIKRDRQGKVELLVYLDENGELLEVSLDSSSGYGILDSAASKAVHKAAPFPELTAVAREEFLADNGTSYVMPIPITFKLYN